MAIQSFDKTTGQPEIAGLSSSDTPTSHGESVAEVVHDMAPDATLTLVNYHTEIEFDQAVDWLMHGPDGKPRVDIIVHSNSFLDGPFDGTGETARTVDAARAAGILWVNSAGNYARRHFTGSRRRPRRRHLRRPDRSERPHVLDPRERRHGRVAAVVRLHDRRQARPGGDRLLRARHHARGQHAACCRTRRACATRRGALEIVSWTAQAAGRYELRARLLTADAVCRFDVFVGGVDLDQPTVAESVPTPGDAAGLADRGSASTGRRACSRPTRRRARRRTAG